MDGQDEVINKQEEEHHQEQQQQEQQEGGSASQTMIKGKRTKRQRPQSPIPFRMITPPHPNTHNNSHISSPTKSDHGSGICSSNNNNNDHNNNHTEENSSNLMEANDVDHHLTLSIATTITTTTTFSDEEEDIANVLILLAQGQARVPINIQPKDHEKPVLTSILQQDTRQDGNNNNNVGVKFTSRKFMEVTTAGKSCGYYVYECKTCSKTFSSFQALGGHRASHKKPKMAHPNTIKNNYNSSLFIDDDDPPFTTSSSSLSLHLNNSKMSMMYGNQSRPRVHECAICGAEFSSGQALGGHMRRHRGMVVTPAPPPLAAAVVAEQAEPMAIELMKMPTNNNNNNNNNTTLSLDLDLNLPAPSDDVVVQNQQQHRQPEQPPSSATQLQNQQPQQQPLVLSSFALVDCHY